MGEDSLGYLGLVVNNSEVKVVVDEINVKCKE